MSHFSTLQNGKLGGNHAFFRDNNIKQQQFQKAFEYMEFLMPNYLSLKNAWLPQFSILDFNNPF